MHVMKTKLLLLLATSLTLGVFACRPPETLVPPPPDGTPSPIPTASISPVPTVTPTPTAPPSPFQITELENGDLVSDSFKLEFGPGSKGIKLDFGPGTKGPELEFGPGTKGPQNLTFNIGFPNPLTNPNLQPFQVKQLGLGGGLLNQLSLEIVRENLLYAKATVLPLRNNIEVPSRFHPGDYSVSVVANTATGPLRMSWSQFKVLAEYNAELKVSVFGENVAKPEDLDVEIVSRNRIPREDSPTP